MTKNEFNPKWFGMTGDPISYTNYIKLLERKSTGYLSYMIDYVDKLGAMTPKRKNMMKESYDNLSDKTKKNIVKNFGETIGPLGILRLGLFGNIKESSYKIQYPEAENMGLYDYLIFNGKKQIRISAKGMTGKTNTVKPKDIVSVYSKRSDVPENARVAYDFVKMISEESTNEGSQKALEFLKTKYPSAVTDLLPAAFKNKSVKSKVMAETVFEQLSRDKNAAFSKEMNNLFWGALDQLNVHYIKFGVNRAGIPEFQRVSDLLHFEFSDGSVEKISAPEDYHPFVYFRGKGREAGVKRAEKPGFQL